MKNINKKILISMVIVIPIILFGVVGYKSYTENKVVTDFNKYLIEYQEEINTYIFTDNKENYESLIKESDQAILDKDSKKIEELKLTLNQFKEDILKTNSELVNKNISELESMDISKLDDKDSILSKTEDIKKLRDENQFIKANEDFIILKTNINTKLEVIKEEEKKKAVEESKRIEEEKKKAEEETKKNELSNPRNTVLYGFNAGKSKESNLHITPVKTELYEWKDGNINTIGSKAVLDLDSTNCFLLTPTPFDEKAKPESLIINDPLGSNFSFITWVLEKNDNYYLIQYQTYDYLLRGGTGSRFNRKVYLNGSVDGNGTWNEPYHKIL